MNLSYLNALQILKPLYWSLAIAMTRFRSQQQPLQPEAHHDLAKALIKQQQWSAAIAACQTSIDLDPTCPWRYKTLAEAYAGKGLWESAIAASDRGIDLDPTLSWLHYTLGVAHLGTENWDEAIAAYKRAIKIEPETAWFYYSLGVAFIKSGNWDAAIPVLKQAIELDPKAAWTYHYLGKALLAKGETLAAIDIYDQVVQRHPEIRYLGDCLSHARHLETQEQRIQAYCAKAQTQGSSDRLRILMIAPFPTYPPKIGVIMQMSHMMQVLGKRHKLVVMSFIFMESDYRLEAEIAPFCELGLTVMLGDAPPQQPPQPNVIHSYSSERMRTLLHQLQSVRFDIVLCEFVWMAQYADLFPDAYRVLQEYNIESQLLRRSAEVSQDSAQLQQLAHQRTAVKAFVSAESQAEQLSAYEDANWPKFDLRLVVSTHDQQEMDSRCQVGESLVFNNGIDTRTIPLLEPTDNLKILFIGTLSYYPNIDGIHYFVQEILPLVWQRCPTLHFCIAGAEPPASLLELAQNRISIVANPEEMSDVAKDCCATVVPLRIGSGTRIKILHSMAMGLPVISTSLGCEGLAVEDGIHLLVRDRPDAFADGILQLISTPTLRQQLRQNGRTLVEQAYDCRSSYESVEGEIVSRWQKARRSQPL